MTFAWTADIKTDGAAEPGNALQAADADGDGDGAADLVSSRRSRAAIFGGSPTTSTAGTLTPNQNDNSRGSKKPIDVAVGDIDDDGGRSTSWRRGRLGKSSVVQEQRRREQLHESFI